MNPKFLLCLWATELTHDLFAGDHHVYSVPVLITHLKGVTHLSLMNMTKCPVVQQTRTVAYTQRAKG